MAIFDRAKNERTSVIVDCILGVISATIGLTGIIFFTIPAWNSPGYLIGLFFWLFWLGLCVYFIALGISVHYANKNYDPDAQPRRDLRAPIVS